MSRRPVTLDDIEAAIRYRFPASQADVDTLRSLVAAYAEAEGLALARQRVLGHRQGELMVAAVPGSPDDAALRAVRAEVRWRRQAGLPVPAAVEEMARQYERDRKRAQRSARPAGQVAGVKAA